MEIPLFPLHTVLCPGIALPLHIFELRYRLMVERCLADDLPFGVVLIREGREVGGDTVSVAGVGTLAEIRQATRDEGGRYELLVVGSGRFAIDDVDAEQEPYLVATVTPLEDEMGDRQAAERIATRTMRRFVDYLHLLQPVDGETAEEIDVRVEVEVEPETALDPDSGEVDDAIAGDDEEVPPLGEAARRLMIPDDPTILSYLLSGIIQVETPRRQHLLEAQTTEERLAALGALIERELWSLRRRLRHFMPDREHALVRRN